VARPTKPNPTRPSMAPVTKARSEEAATITAVVVPPTDPNQRHVRVGRRTVARVTASEAAALGLRVGASWDARRQARVESALARAALRRVALQLFARRTVSAEELRAHLARRGCGSAAIRTLLRGLVRDGWLTAVPTAAAPSRSVELGVPARPEARGSTRVPSARRGTATRGGGAVGLGTRALGTSAPRTRRERS